VATAYKILGQVNPVEFTNTDLYVANGITGAVCSTLVICNRDATTNVSVAVRPAGATLANQHYILYENYISQQDSMFLTIGITLANTDVVTVRAGSNTTSFSLFGSEITA
jgi:hypothetical protein